MASSINASTSGAGGVITTADNTGILNLQTAGTTAVTIDASQNVGIGTTSPIAPMHIKKTWATGYGTLLLDAPSGTQYSGMVCSNNGTAQGFVYWDNTNSLFDIYSNSGMAFFAGASERMRIADTGVVLIGSASVFSGANSKLSALWDPSSQNGFTLKASGTTFSNYAIAFRTSSDTTSGYISQAASTVTYSTSSDYRLKENIAPMTGALDTVAKLKPVTYKWKADGSDGQGFIAHELQEIVPDCVTGEKDAVDEEGNIKPQGVDTSFLVATLTAAIQEQQALITSLTARITALEAK